MNNIEKELISRASKGDKRAFCDLISMHRAKLRSFAVSITGGNIHLADDVLQEALIKAYVSMNTYEVRSSFTTWLWRIIKNEFINYLRDSSTKVEMMSDSESDNSSVLASDENIEDEMMKMDVKKEVHFLIDQLPMKLKIAIVLIDIQELSYEEAAEILEISLTAMKSRVFKGRKRLTEIVNEKKELKQLSSEKNRQTDESEDEE